MKYPTIKELAEVVRHVKQQVPRVRDADANDYREGKSDLPSIQLTIGWDAGTGDWSYQTGDNSYTGVAYGYPVWAVTYVYRVCNSRDIARDIIDQLHEAEAAK